MNVHHCFTRFVWLGAAIAAVGCSGGLSNVTPTRAPVPLGKSVQARVSIHVPPKSTLRKRPLFVSPFTASVTVSIDGGTPQETDLASSSPNCTTTTSGTTCSIAILATAGQHQFTFQTFDQIGGQGNLLSSNTVTQTLTANAANVINVTLNAVVASVQVAVTGTNGGIFADDAGKNYSVGLGSSQTLTFTPLDAHGDLIVGQNVPAVTQASLANGSGGTFTIAPVSNQPNTFTFTVPATAGSTDVNVQVAGVPAPIFAGTYTAAGLTAQPSLSYTLSLAAAKASPTGVGTPFTIIENGYAGLIFPSSTTCNSVLNAQGGFSLVAFTSGTVGLVAAVGPLDTKTGTCTTTYTDLFGQTITLTLVVTP